MRIESLRLNTNYRLYRQLVNGSAALSLGGIGIATIGGIFQAFNDGDGISVAFPVFLGASLLAFLTLAGREAGLMLADAADALFLIWRESRRARPSSLEEGRDE